MKRNNTMRKKIIAFAILITMLCNNSAVSAWAAADEETQMVSSSENNEPSVDIPDEQEEQTESGETMTGTEATDSDREQPEAADQGTDSSENQSEESQEDIPVASPDEVIEIEDYIREEFGEEYVPLMNEKLEGDEIPGYEDLEERNGSDNEFIVDLALSSNEHWWQNKDSFDAFKNNGYEYDREDINAGSGMSSKYIFMGWKYTNDIQANIGSVITGILIKIGSHVDSFKYNNKTYHPLTSLFRDSNGDLNQGAGGDYLYIYYTRDGAEKGDPVICTDKFGIAHQRDSGYLVADGIDDNGSITKEMDINKKGVTRFLSYKYHTHTLEITPYEDGHTSKCNKCNFHSVLQEHEYEYVSISDSKHEGTCKTCKHKIQASHMDSNEDGKCDDCQTPVEVMITIPGSGEPTQTGAYKTFTAAWNDAIAKNTDCSINLLKVISLMSGNIAQEAQHLTPIENGKTITIQNPKKHPEAKLTIDGDTFKNFSEVFYVRNGGLIIDTDITIDGGVSFNSVITASSSAAKLMMDDVATVEIKGHLNKDLSFITADESARLEVSKLNLVFSGNRGSKPYSIYGIHIMNGSTADIALATINDLDQAFRVYKAKLDIHGGHYKDKTVVYVEEPGNNSEILIQGGEFTGTDGYCLDSSDAKVSIESGNFTGSLLVSENQKIISVLASGIYAAEIDASDHITRHIPYSELVAAGNRITFAKRTRIIECTNHYASEAQYYSRKTHKGICLYCGQEKMLAHVFNADGFCTVCKTEKEIILITSAGIYEYYDCIEDAVKAIRERTNVTIMPTRDIVATDAFFIAYEGGEKGDRKRLTIDLNGFNMALNDTGVTQVLEGYDLTIQNGTVQIFDKGLTLKKSELTIDTCILSSTGLELIDSKFHIGKDGKMNGTPQLTGDSILQLTDNSNITAEWTLTVHNGQQVLMSDQSTFVLPEGNNASAIMVEKGGSLILSDEALIDDLSLESRMAIHYAEGAIISFAGGGVRKDYMYAITPFKMLNTRISEFLVPGYAYYKYESGEEFSEYDIDSSNNITEAFIVRPHKDHKYKYFDMGDGTHQAVCALCKITGPTSPHVGQNDSNLCAKCNASFVCKHDFNDDGICKYCSLAAEACVIIDDEKTFYVAFEDAWKQAKGKKATIRALKKLSNLWHKTLTIEDKDDITIENGKILYATEEDTFIVNGGKLTITSGHFEARDMHKWSMIINRGEVIINNGHFSAGNGIQVNGGKLTITDMSTPGFSPCLRIREGSVTVKGGAFNTILSDDNCIEVRQGRSVKDLLPTGYYYAVTGENIPAKIDENHPSYIKGGIFGITVKLHEDHTGYWKDGVCSICRYECTHPSFEGSRCTVCGVEIESKLFVVYKEGDDSKREHFDHLQDALNFASQHPGSELIVSKDIPADATDKTSYIVPDEGLSVDSPIDFSIQLGKNTIGTQLFIKKARVTIKGDGGGINVSAGSALYIGVDADVHVENCNFHTDDSKFAAISIKDSKSAYLKNVHANGGYAVDASDVKDTVTLDGGYYCTASGDKDSALEAVAITGTSGMIKGCTITATAEDAAALYLYRCERVVIDNTRLLIDDTAKGANSIRIPSRGSSETELTIGAGSEIYEMASGKNITDDYSKEGRISDSVDKSVYIGKAFPEKQAQIIGYEPLADIEFPAGTAIDDIIAKIPTEANAVTLNYPDKKVKVKVAFDLEEIRKAIQKVYDQEMKTLSRGENRVRTKKIDIYAKGIVSEWPEDISVVLESTLNLRLCVEVRKYNVNLNDGQTKQEYFTGDVVELHVDDHIHGKVFSHWEVVEGDVNFDISLQDTSFIMPSENLVINAVYEDQLELVTEKAATCTKPGNKAYYICDCGQWFRSPEDAKADKPIADHSEFVIPATGHVDKDADGYCDVCREKLSNKNIGGGSDSRTNGNAVADRNTGIFTGDNSNLFFWFVLLAGSSLALCLLIRRRRSR